MKKKIIAFYDLLFFSIIAGIMWTVAIVIFITGRIGDFDWCVENLHLVLVYAVCIAVPFTAMLCLQKIHIDLSCDSVNWFYLVDFRRNDRDMHTNWTMYPSEIESIEIVRLSKEEKRKYTSARFLFNKYLKVNFRFGHSKYVYVSHYSNSQIKRIISILTAKNT